MPSSPKAIASATPQVRMVGRFSALFVAMRPQQWTKNLAIFVGIVFAQQLLDPTSFERGMIAFAAFCLASSSIYLFNDLLDLENDRQHPKKKVSPPGSGTLPAAWAWRAIVFLWLACMGLATSPILYTNPRSGHIRRVGGQIFCLSVPWSRT